MLTFRVSTRGPAYRDSEPRQRFFKDLNDRFAAIPGVESVGAAQFHPFYPQFGLTMVVLEGQPAPEPGKEPRVTAIRATPDYFSAMKMPLLRGRLFTENEPAGLRRSRYQREVAGSAMCAETPAGSDWRWGAIASSCVRSSVLWVMCGAFLPP